MSRQLSQERLTSLLLGSWRNLHEIHEAASRLAMLLQGEKRTELIVEVRTIAAASELPLPVQRLVKLLDKEEG